MNGIESILVKYGLPTDGFALNGEKKDASLSELRSRLIRSREKTFSIAGHDLLIDFSLVRNHDLEFLEIQTKQSSAIPYDAWVDQFAGNSQFVIAWLADAEYSYWQNAHDPFQYRSAGRTFDHLPTKSNGLPYPLEQTVIDTSANPGRRVLRCGYIETVGSVMWFGSAFWKILNSSPAKVDVLPWLKKDELANGVIRVEAAAEPFTSGDGEMKEKQLALRRAIFTQ